MSLEKKATLSALFSVATSVFMRVIGLVGTLLLVRHLSTDSYGEVSAASILVLSAHQISALGVGLFLVTNPTAGAKHVFHANLVHVALGVVALVLVVVFREPLGPWTGAPGLSSYVPGLALAVFIERLGQVPEKLLVRDLRFGTLALQRGAAEAAYTAVSVGLAVAGFGAMSVVWGNLARAIVKTAIIIACVSPRTWLAPHPIDRRVLRDLVGFGISVSVGGLAVFAARRWDNLVMTAAFGTSVGGLYNLAYNLAAMPASQIGEQISDVLVASFPKLDPARRRAALLRAVRVLAIVIVPMSVGLALVSPALTRLFLSAEWQAAGPFLVVLSFLSIPMPLCGAIFAYMQSFNRSWAWAGIEWASVAVLLGLMFALRPFGPLAAAAAVGVGFTARYVMFLWLLKVRDGFTVMPFLAELLPPLLASGAMTLAVLAAARAYRGLGFHGALGELVVEVVTGGVVYAGAALLVAPRAARDVLGLLRGLAERRGPRKAAVA